MSLSAEERLFDSSFVNFSKKQKGNLKDKSKMTLEEKMKFSYDYFNIPKTSSVENVCKLIIKKFPKTEMGISFYAIDILRQFYERQSDMSSYYKFLEEVSANPVNYIDAWAGLLLSDTYDDTRKVELLDKIKNKFGNTKFGEMALFLKFIHFYFNRNDKNVGTVILNEMDKKYGDSYYTYNAHLLIKDKGFSSQGLHEIEVRDYKKVQELAKGLHKNAKLFEETLKQPVEFEVSNNFPNPFNLSTSIMVTVPKNQHVKICIYNSLGQLIKTLIDEELTPGEHKYEWNGLNEYNNVVSSGIYFYKVTSGNYSFSNKMILQK